MSDSKVSEKKSRTVAIAIAILAAMLVGAIVVFFGMYINLQNQINTLEAPKQSSGLTIASFKSSIMDNTPQVQAYLDLEVNHYWTKGNTVYCNGTIRWRTTEWTLDGMNIALCVDSTGTSGTVGVELLVYSGGLLTGQNTINSISMAIPKLGNQTFSYDFSLNCEG
jgi:predicted PurR-regulated permease PerM